MGAAWDTTQRDDESVVGRTRPQLWLRWAFPAIAAPVLLEHGMVFGRDAECTVRLEGGGVSRRHAEVYRQGPVFALKDLGSTNGTFLNGKRIQHAAIVPGSVLRLGEHIGVFVESAHPPSGFRALASGLYGGHELEIALLALNRAAGTDIPIVVIGATGTGKERVARAVHELSGRKGPFHALNCAALPKDLAEAELFGYRKGSFTGAERASLGHFRAADRGTLFLDEIADLPLGLQAKLLRVLQEGAVTPLGETEAIPIDIRVVVAAHRPLTEAVAAQRFRDDLLARLAGLTVTLPPLHERRADISPLFQHFVAKYSGGRPPRIEPKLIEALSLYAWPTNVRELEYVARRMLAVHGLEAVLKRSALPPELLAALPAATDSVPPAAAEPSDRREHDTQRLVVALQQSQGSVASAATLLGISRQRAYRLLNGRSPAALMAQELVTGSETPDNDGS